MQERAAFEEALAEERARTAVAEAARVAAIEALEAERAKVAALERLLSHMQDDQIQLQRKWATP